MLFCAKKGCEMYNKNDILKNLVEYNYFIDETTLSNFIKNWKIDAIYEDEDGVEFFDNLSIIKLKKGISLKSQGYTNEQIVYHISKIAEEKLPVKKEKKEVELGDIQGELKNLTIDITGQTLQMLADAVASKITSDIKTQLLQDGSIKKENETLTKQVEELTADNKKLAQRVEELEKSKKICLINFEYLKKFFK